MRTDDRNSGAVYVLLVLALLACVSAIWCFVKADQLDRVSQRQMQAIHSAQLLAERMRIVVEDPAQRAILSQRAAEMTTLVDTLDLPPLQLSWKHFSELLPQPTQETRTLGSKAPVDMTILVSLSDALVSWLEKIEAPVNQIESASHLYQLAGSVRARLIAGEESGAQPLRARGPWLVYQQILNRFESYRESGALIDADALSLLTELRSEFDRINQRFRDGLEVLNTEAARSNTPELLSAHADLVGILASEATAGSFRHAEHARWFQAGLFSALAAMALLGLLSIALWRDERRRQRLTINATRQDQASILKLLDEISSLADGNLNVQATVSEDLTGAIADSFNYAVTELRRLVSAITNSADRVTVAVEETGASATQLANASSQQSREIQRSASYLQAMSDTMEQMTERSREASDIAGRSVEHAASGKKSVDETLQALNRIRAQMEQTTGLLSRLGENSERIGDVVTLINKAAADTRLLALNSAIKSSSSDMTSHRFSELADDVQSLADSLKHSANEIDMLSQIIQDDARSAMIAMEHTNAEVVAGQELARNAGIAHQDIENISRRLSVVVEHLSKKTSRQSEVVHQLSANMTVINDVTRSSAHGMQLSAAALDDLRRMAVELRDGVADFALPSQAMNGLEQDELVGRPLLKKRELPLIAAENSIQDNRIKTDGSLVDAD